MARGHEAYWLPIFLLGTLLSIATFAPAQAADRLTECCVELDARIAELASALLSDNVHNVKVQIYGQVNRDILFWKDGINSRLSFVDNSTSSSRLGLVGEGTIRPGLTVGVRFEVEFVWPASAEIFDPRDVTHAQSLTDAAVRQAYGFINDEHLGTLTVGHQWSASGDLTIINLGSQMNDAALHYNNSFNVGLKIANGIFTDLKWGQIAENVDLLRGNISAMTRPCFTASCSLRRLAIRTLGMLRYAITPMGKLFVLRAGSATETIVRISWRI